MPFAAWSSLLFAFVVAPSMALVAAQEPASAVDSVPLAALGVSDAPGGVDFRDAAKVRDELTRVRDAVEKLDPQAQAGLVRQLKRQQDVLARQRDLLAERERLAPLQAETSEAALQAARAARDAARVASTAFDSVALQEQLRETADPEALAAQLGAARSAVDIATTELAAAAGEVASLPRKLDDARASLLAAHAELEALRSRGAAAADEPIDIEPLEQALAAEEELVHHRQRIAWLELLAPWLERRHELRSTRLQQALANQELAAATLAAARRLAQESLAEATRRAGDEVKQRERELAESGDERDRGWHEEALATSRLDAEERAQAESQAAIEQRREAAEQELVQARSQRDGYRARYRGTAAGERRDDATQVAREINELQALTRFFDHQAARSELRGELRAAEAAQAAHAEATRARREQLIARREATRAIFTPDEWTKREAARWSDLEAKRVAVETPLARSTAERAALARRRLDIEEQVWEARNDALAILRSENLFLVEESEITRATLAGGVDDLMALPSWALDRAAAFAGWCALPGRLRSLAWCVLALLPLALLVVLPRLWLKRRIDGLLGRELASLPTRAALLFAHLGRCACTAAAFWLAPRIAASLLVDLPELAVELLHAIGDRIAIFWLGLGLVHELLHPDPPERQLLAVDRRTSRRVGAGVLLLLWMSLSVALLELLLTRLAYRNVGAMAAVDLAHNVAAGATLVFVLLQRQLLMSLLPEPDRTIGRLLRSAAGLIHPMLVLLVPTVVVLDAVGYRIFAGFITRVAILALTAFPIGSIAYQAVVFVLEGWRDRHLAKVAGNEASVEREQARVRALDEIARFLLRIAVILLVGFALLQFTGTSFASLRSFFERPLPFQAATELAARKTWWDVVVAVLIAVLALRIARHLKLALESLLLPLTQLARSTQYTITTLVVYLLHGIGFWLALTQLLDLRNLGYLVAALSVGIGFGLQEIISNFVSGVILLIERPIKPGDTIGLGDGSVGTVRELGIRATTIQTTDNIHILVPNREFITQRVVNHDAIDPRVRTSIAVGVAYGSDVKRVRDVLLEVAAKDGRVLKKPAPDVQFANFGDSALDFRLYVWLEDSTQVPRVASDLRFAIDAAFARFGIAIPFPQREVVLRADKPLRVTLDPPTPPGPQVPPRGDT
ncbi:MAG: mechanosensitive ion channel [Planctomycetes bacterium]|nr:mechanosensitive ion channel [Planctomycetota bacterium]